MTAYPYTGADVSWPQGNFAPSGQQFEIIGACTDDSGNEEVQSTYHEQVNNARARGIEIGHYFFNGSTDPTTFARFCAANLYNFEPGDSVWLDVETQSNRGPAYSPAQALTFGAVFESLTGVMPGIYLNESEMNGFNWAQNVQAGQLLWLAYYSSSLPGLSYWPQATMWQYTSTPIDNDRSIYTQAQIRSLQQGNSPQEEEMTTYELVKVATNATVYFSVNRLQRYALPNESVLSDYQFFMKQFPAASLPGGTAVQTVASLPSFGAVVVDQPFNVSVTVPPMTDAQVTALAEALAPQLDAGATPAEIATAVDAALSDNFAAIPAAVIKAEATALGYVTPSNVDN